MLEMKLIEKRGILVERSIRGVTVIGEANEFGDSSSNPGRGGSHNTKR